MAAISSNVREHICNGRLRLSPLNLRLSPGDRAEGVDGNSDAYNTRIRGKETKVPVAFQRRLARAQCHVPYLEGPVFGS